MIDFSTIYMYVCFDSVPQENLLSDICRLGTVAFAISAELNWCITSPVLVFGSYHQYVLCIYSDGARSFGGAKFFFFF